MMDETRIAKGLLHLDQMEKAKHQISYKTLCWFMAQFGGTESEAFTVWRSSTGGKLDQLEYLDVFENMRLIDNQDKKQLSLFSHSYSQGFP